MLGRTEKESRLQLLERITMERSTKKVTFEQRLEEGEEIVPADILEKNVPSRGAGPEAGPCAGCLKNEEARVAGATEHGKQ